MVVTHQLPPRRARLPGPPVAQRRVGLAARRATTACWTSRRRCAGSSATSRTSAATRATSRSSASRPAASACTRTSPPRSRRAVPPGDRRERRLPAEPALAGARPRRRGHAVRDPVRLHRPDRRLPAGATGADAAASSNATIARPERRRLRPHPVGRRGVRERAVQPGARHRGQQPRRVAAVRGADRSATSSRCRPRAYPANLADFRGGAAAADRRADARANLPAGELPQPSDRVGAIGTDAIFACNARRAANRCPSS